MKCKKKYLGLILSLCITSSIFMGCNNEKSLNSDDIDSAAPSEETLSNASSSNVDSFNENEEISQELIEEANDVKILKKEEALKLVENEVHKVFPNAKLKLKSDEYPNREGFYLIQYDTPYCTTAEFAIDPYTGYIQACEEGTSNYMDMDTWREKIEEYSNSERYKQTTAEKAMATFVSKYNFNENHEGMAWTRLSDNQLNSFELVSNELVEYQSGHCGWVFRYPLEKEPYIYENKDDNDCNGKNAVNKDDKYGYIFFEPQYAKSPNNDSMYCTHACYSASDFFYWEDYPSDNDY